MKKGFATLFLIIILGSLALSTTFLNSNNTFFNLKKSINLVNLSKARWVSTGCAEVILDTIRLSHNSSGSGNLVLNNYTCTYQYNSNGTSASINIQTIVNNVYSKIFVSTTGFDPIVISDWQELQ